MSAQPQHPKPLVLILPDNTALCFSASNRARAHDAPPRPASRRDKIAAFFKSFLPKVARVAPVRTRLSTGRELDLITPATTF